jgi:predicted dehydrogenase
MLRVAVVGCGKIADDHLALISTMAKCEIVAACDREDLMAKQLCERFSIKRRFTDLDALLGECKPDVVHVTTPPQGHFQIGKKCLEAGSHVYIEKPFTVYGHEAEELIGIAKSKGLKITAGHDDQFTHAARRMRALIESGYLGGRPVHMESYYCYDLGDASYAKSLLGDKDHWVRRLPGTLMQNNISHGIARIAEFLPHDNPLITVHGFVSPLLAQAGETQIIDEARVVISAGNITAYFTFSTQMRPALKVFRVYGAKNGLMIDHDQQWLIRLKGTRYKSYLEKFIPPLEYAVQYVRNSTFNLKRFLANDFHMKSGMKFLIEAFYGSIANDTEPPIPYDQIIRTSRMMDCIFAQLGSNSSSPPPLGACGEQTVG